MRKTRRVSRWAALCLLPLLLAGCFDNSAPQSKTYNNGAITEIPKSERNFKPEFEGQTSKGETYRSSDHLGKIQVVNFWYSSCPPCRREAPTLQEAWSETLGENVQFIGVNVRDSKPLIDAFEEEFGITFPSIMDAEQRKITLVFNSMMPRSMPVTFVLDEEGKVAGRIMGAVPTKTVLLDMIRGARLNASS